MKLPSVLTILLKVIIQRAWLRRPTGVVATPQGSARPLTGHQEAIFAHLGLLRTRGVRRNFRPAGTVAEGAAQSTSNGQRQRVIRGAARRHGETGGAAERLRAELGTLV